MLHSGLQALQPPDQREGDADLQEHQNGASRLAPDAGPDERQKSHAAVRAGAPLSRDGSMMAAKPFSAKLLGAVTLSRPRRRCLHTLTKDGTDVIFRSYRIPPA